MKVKHYIYLLLLTALPLLCGCNNEDDVTEIFTGKLWKLSKISAEGSHLQINYWGADAEGAAFQKSMALLKSGDNFTISFTGGEINNTVGGTFSGKGVTTTFNGKWLANGESHKLSMDTNLNGNETDVLAKAFINGLQNVIRYEGDANNLFIYFSDGQTVKYMGFTPKR